MSQALEQLTEEYAQDTQYYRRVLLGLVEMANDIACVLHRQATAPADAAPPGDADLAPKTAPQPATTADTAAAFDKITRVIRRTILLARKITEPVAAPAMPRPDHRTAMRKRIIRAVEDTIQRSTKGKEAAERLHGELLDRLDEPDLDDDIAARPVSEIIADICRDLGLDNMPGTHPWKRRTPEDIAILAARAAMKPPRQARDPGAGPTSAPTTVVVDMWPGQRTAPGRSTDPP